MVITYQLKDTVIYVGVDKFENEELIHYAQRFMERTGITLFWFHADRFSSPHAYIRMREGQTEPDPGVMAVCCQICKNGSIKGCKEQAIDVVYTTADNLMKTNGMEPGQVSFHRSQLCKFARRIRKNNEILNKLEQVKGSVTMHELEVELEDLAHQRTQFLRAQEQAARRGKRNVQEERQRENEFINERNEMLSGMTQADDEPFDEDDFM